MEKILKLCPGLTKIKVLMEDLNFRYFEMLPHLEEVSRNVASAHLSINLQYEVEAHVTWSGLTAGLELFVLSLCSLTSLDITILDNYSWASIVNIGAVCVLLSKFHLTLWREEEEDANQIDDL